MSAYNTLIPVNQLILAFVNYKTIADKIDLVNYTTMTDFNRNNYSLNAIGYSSTSEHP